MASRITITLDDAEEKALIALAQRERRQPRDQAAMMIRHELERRGLLVDDVGTVGSRSAAELPSQDVDGDRADVLARVYALILSWPTNE